MPVKGSHQALEGSDIEPGMTMVKKWLSGWKPGTSPLVNGVFHARNPLGG